VLNDVAAAADDHWSSAFCRHGDQGHVLDEIGMPEESDFLLGEAAFRREEAPEEGGGAGLADSREKIGLVSRREGTDVHAAPGTQRLDRRIFGCL
jgi:hypothetical protein